MPIETIRWRGNTIRLIDQTLLPARCRYITCRDVRQLWRAIKALKVRGAPAIGVAGALGVVLGVTNDRTRSSSALVKKACAVARYLATSRPTAVNLFWALARMEETAKKNRRRSPSAIKDALLAEALSILEEDKRICRAMARRGSRLVKDGDRILTHCNAGGLATAGYGTALGVLFAAKAEGKRFTVFADETRPLLQGARLTTWELMREGIPTVLICDNMAASLMGKGMIDTIFVGADRIAANGDFANKIGTYGLAVLAHHHGVPLYVVAPVSTFDVGARSGRDIPVEERDADEVRTVLGTPIAPKRVRVYNPAFDVTPARFVRAFVTEKGVFRAPYHFARALKGAALPLRKARRL